MNIPQFYINEIFDSVQGEGALLGYRTLFVRLQGCSVGCKWCDTKNSWKQKEKHKVKSVDLFEIINDHLTSKDHWICITGGEPLEQFSSVKWLVEKLVRNGFEKITVETAGIPMPDRKDVFDLYDSGVFFSLSPKLPSALKRRFDYNEFVGICDFWNTLIYLPYKLQFKFVVSDEQDLEVLDKYLLDNLTNEHHLFMQIEDSKVEDKKFIETALDYHLQSHFRKVRIVAQQHKMLGLR